MKIMKTSFVLAFSLFFMASAFSQTALKRANKQYELSAFNLAIKSYQEVLSKDANHLEANSKIADCYRHLNQQEKALPHYQAAVAQEGVDPMYVFQYGLTLQELGRYDIARQVFTKLGENVPEFKTRATQFAEACVFAQNSQEVPLFKVSNEYVNTSSSDFGAAIFKDRVVYTSGREDIRSRDSRSAPSGSDGSNRMFITQRDKNGFLEVPVTLHAGFGNATNEGPVAYSPDGSMVAITKNNFIDGTRLIPSSGMELTLYTAQVNDQGDWSTAIPFIHNVGGASTGFPAFSSDGKALFFASDRPGGFGGFDLYVSYKIGNNWSAPENLGSTVNSIGNEITPFHDGNSLYFASDYHRGFGGFDIFRAEENSSRWATLFHGGPGLNSAVDDFGFVFDSARNAGYFVSNRPGGKGSEDLYRIQKETESVVIKVTDTVTGVGIGEATIDFSDCGEKSYQTNANGIFNFQLLDNLNCTATISKEGYISQLVKITSLGLRQNRTLDVALTNANQAYSGKIVNASTGYVLEGGKVIATNQATQEVVTAMSDSKGDYMIALATDATYVIRYSKAGFRDLSFNFKTQKSDRKNIQNIELLPVGASATVPASMEKEIETATTDGTTTVVSGYAVQLAATSSASVDLAPYRIKAGDSGNIYAVKEGGKTKIRLGLFDTREAAVVAQKKVVANGFAGAFIVEDKREVKKQPETSMQPAKVQPKEIVETKKPEVELEGYMVRLATFRDINNFKKGLVDDVGVISFLPKGDVTIVLLTGYDSKSSAEIGLRKARARGFPEAFMVTMEGGELRKAE